jgi:hypothetical protein
MSTKSNKYPIVTDLFYKAHAFKNQNFTVSKSGVIILKKNYRIRIIKK